MLYSFKFNFHFLQLRNKQTPKEKFSQGSVLWINYDSNTKAISNKQIPSETRHLTLPSWHKSKSLPWQGHPVHEAPTIPGYWRGPDVYSFTLACKEVVSTIPGYWRCQMLIFRRSLYLSYLIVIFNTYMDVSLWWQSTSSNDEQHTLCLIRGCS